MTSRLARALTATAIGAVAAASPARADPFDGLYSGPLTMMRNAGGKCSQLAQFRMRVKNSQFAQPWDNRTVTLEGQVAADGSFGAQAGRSSISGKISGAHMEGNIGNEYCRWSFSADRS